MILGIVDILHNTFLQILGSLSVRSFIYSGSGLSMLDRLHVGGDATIEKDLDVRGDIFGSMKSLSVSDLVKFGSSLSVRSFVNIGLGMSVGGGINARKLQCQGTLSVCD